MKLRIFRLLKRIKALRQLRGWSLAAVVAVSAPLMTSTGVVAYRQITNDEPENAFSANQISEAAELDNIEAKEETDPKKSKPSSVSNDPDAATPSNPNVGEVGGSLNIIPSSVTVQAGKSAPITISSSNGSSVNMPMFQSSSIAWFNFAAGGAKPRWSGSITADDSAKPGTYTLKVLSQNSKDYFGAITVTITPKPGLSLSLRQNGYSDSFPAQGFILEITRLHGYNKPVSSIIITGASCGVSPHAGDTYSFSCTALGPSKLTGTMNLTVNTTDGSFSTSTKFRFPFY